MDKEQYHFSTDEIQAIREQFIAPAIKSLENIAASQPVNGQYLTFAKNHLRMAFMELGYGSALEMGLDPLANKVKKD